jgi:hypothetical protein
MAGNDQLNNNKPLKNVDLIKFNILFVFIIFFFI